MTLYLWDELTREQLGAVLPRELVVLPVGATEQHGPHLPTGTDAIIVSEVVRAAARTAETALDLVLAPPLPFGASDHHMPFGGTLSLRVETMTDVLLDLARSVHRAGAIRLLLVNGHGGNRGACHSAAQRAATAYGMQIAYADYWELLRADRPARPDDPPVPGHAGAFESGLIARLRPHLVGELPERTPPEVSGVRGVTMQEQAAWTRTDGFSDNPAAAVDGGEWFDACVAALAARLVVLAAA